MKEDSRRRRRGGRGGSGYDVLGRHGLVQAGPLGGKGVERDGENLTEGGRRGQHSQGGLGSDLGSD